MGEFAIHWHCPADICISVGYNIVCRMEVGSLNRILSYVIRLSPSLVLPYMERDRSAVILRGRIIVSKHGVAKIKNDVRLRGIEPRATAIIRKN